MSRSFWTLMVGLVFLASGCEPKPVNPTPGNVTPGNVTPDDVRQDIGKALDTTTKSAEQTKEDFQRNLRARINELEAEIAKLREQGRDFKDETKSSWDHMVADLETKREAARVKLDEIGRSSAEAWRDIQKGAQSAWDDLDKAFQEASNKF